MRAVRNVMGAVFLAASLTLAIVIVVACARRGDTEFFLRWDDTLAAIGGVSICAGLFSFGMFYELTEQEGDK